MLTNGGNTVNAGTYWNMRPVKAYLAGRKNKKAARAKKESMGGERQ